MHPRLRGYLTVAVVAAVAFLGGFCAPAAFGQWGGASCPPVGRPVLRQIPFGPGAQGTVTPFPPPGLSAPKPVRKAAPRWWGKPEYPGEWFLYQGGRLLGKVGLDGQYRPWSEADRRYLRADKAPVPPPEARRKVEQFHPWQLDGVDKSKTGTKSGYNVNGKELSKDEAYYAVEKGELRDDSGKGRVTIIGSEPARKQVLHDLENAPELASYRDRVLVQAYPSDHWYPRKLGMVTRGNPTIYCQASDGKVLHRQDDYEGGAKTFGQALKKAYDPGKDPDLRKPEPAKPNQPRPDDPDAKPGTVTVSWQTMALFGMGALLLFMFFKIQTLNGGRQ